MNIIWHLSGISIAKDNIYNKQVYMYIFYNAATESGLGLKITKLLKIIPNFLAVAWLQKLETQLCENVTRSKRTRITAIRTTVLGLDDNEGRIKAPFTRYNL